MAVNKNFVVKNGIEVATDLIFASSDLDKVGIGSTIPTATLEVGGDAKVTGNSTIVGIATFSNNIDANGNLDVDGHTELDDLNVSGVSTFVSAIDANGSLDVDGHTELDDLNVSGVSTFASNLDINASIDVAGIATITGLLDANGGLEANTAKIEDLTDNRIVISGTGGELEDDGNLTFDGTGLVIGGGSHLSVAGVSTLTGNTFVGSAVSIYASSGIVSATAFYGDGSNLSGVTATAGGSLGFSTAGAIGYGVTFLKFVGAGVSTLSAPHSGIATLTIVGGGGGGSASIGIGTTVGDAFPDSPIAGNLWYHTIEGRLFIYYDDGTSSQWVDAAPFNIGIITASLGSLNQGTALAPPLAFSGDSSTGLFSPTSGQQTFVSVGSSILNVNPSGVEVTGIITAGRAVFGSSTGIGTVSIGIGTTALLVDGDARITGILTIGRSSVTIDGSTNKIVVGSGITIDGSTGIISAKSLSVGGQTVSNLGVGIKTEGSTVGFGVTLLDFRGAGVSTITAPSSGISTINITGGGGGASVSISTEAPTSPGDGDLWFDSSDGNTYIYYDSQSVWVVSQTYGY